MTKAWEVVCNHSVFKGILSDLPLGLADAGINPYSTDDMRMVFAAGRCYTCGCNAFWASPFYSTAPGVPVNRQAVRCLSQS